MIVFLAALLGAGVLLGTGALVVDHGYTMDQITVMQNAADAGALAAAKLMASSVANGATGPIYVVTDNQIHAVAADFANDNFAGGRVGAGYEVAVEYLNCSDPPGSTGFFTAHSLTDPLPAIATTRLAADVASSPSSMGPGYISASAVCAVRVYSRVTYSAMFAKIFGATSEKATASATARIYPTAPPTVFTDVWPITHREDGQDLPCAFVFNSNCDTAFWGKQADIGSFKEAVDLSRYSALAGVPAFTQEQLFAPDMSSSPKRIDQNCALLPLFNFKPCYDNSNPPSSWGTNVKEDAYRWGRDGFQGQIYVPVDADLKATSDHRCDTYARAAQDCPNARLETNINGIAAGPMRTALLAAINAGPIDPTCNCHGVTKTVLFWKYGEQNINSTTNTGTAWDDITNTGDKSNDLKRVIINRVRQFRFNTSTVGPNYITGFYIGFYNPNGTPGSGTPNAIANTVKLIA